MSNDNDFKDNIRIIKEQLDIIDRKREDIHYKIYKEIHNNFYKLQEKYEKNKSLARQVMELCDIANHGKKYPLFLKIVKQDLPYIPFSHLHIFGYGISNSGLITLNIEVTTFLNEFTFQKQYLANELAKRISFEPTIEL